MRMIFLFVLLALGAGPDKGQRLEDIPVLGTWELDKLRSPEGARLENMVWSFEIDGEYLVWVQQNTRDGEVKNWRYTYQLGRTHRKERKEDTLLDLSYDETRLILDVTWLNPDVELPRHEHLVWELRDHGYTLVYERSYRWNSLATRRQTFTFRRSKTD